MILVQHNCLSYHSSPPANHDLHLGPGSLSLLTRPIGGQASRLLELADESVVSYPGCDVEMFLHIITLRRMKIGKKQLTIT